MMARKRPGRKAAHKAGVALAHRRSRPLLVGRRGAHNAAVTLDERRRRVR